VDLLFAAQDLMESGSYARQHEEAARALVAAADAAGTALVEGRARLLIGHRAVLCGRFEDADREASRSLALGLAAADPLTSSYAPNLRGLAATVRNDPERTADHHRTAIDAFRADGNRRGESAALSNLSRALIELDDVPGAVRTAERALAILRELEGGFRVGNALYALALALCAARRRPEAQARFAEALAIFQDARQRFWEGLTLFRLSELELTAGHPRQSASLAERALAVLHDVNGGVWEAHALTALGRALVAVGQPDRARACWRQALDTYVSLDAPEAERVRELLDDRSLPPVVAV
jgi:tetratricopeptide (TPR) repeat protein